MDLMFKIVKTVLIREANQLIKERDTSLLGYTGLITLFLPCLLKLRRYILSFWITYLAHPEKLVI